MKLILKCLSGIALLLLLVLAIGAWTLQRWIGTDEFRTRVETEASNALGVTLTLERIEVDVWPWPALALVGTELKTRPALSAQRLEVRPALSGLLSGRLELATLLVRQAVLPQAGIDALLESLSKKKHTTPDSPAPSAQETSSAGFLPTRTVLDRVTWISAKGASSTVDAELRLDSAGLPDQVTIQILKGQFQGCKANLQRQGHQWTLALQAGDGTVNGTFELQPAVQPGGEFALKGQLHTRALQVGMLSGPKPVLSGLLEADTTLAARTTKLGSIGDVLQTQSKFTVRNAVLHGIDLARAIKTVGLSRGGETPLDTLAGQVSSQGRSVQLSQMVASSGVLSANGQVAISPSRTLSGRISVELASSTLGGAVGVPLVVGGTLDAPEVMLTRSALIGAAIGTAVMPGVGTGAGASLGDKVGGGLKKIFGQ